MQKTRLKSDALHGIGENLIDAATEVAVETIVLLAVVVVSTYRPRYERKRAHVTTELRSEKCVRALKADGADPR